MNLYAIHPHALKHGLEESDIRSAWKCAFEWIRRDLEQGGIDYVVIGTDGKGRLIEMIARFCSEVDGYVIFHAMTPPTAKVLKEIGLIR